MNKAILTGAMMAALTCAKAQNPIVQTWFTTDPAPLACGDKMYVYTGHDEDGADFFWMNEWRVYSSSDMVNWTDHGSPLSLASFSWADDRAWAAQCIERGGKYYWYICAHSRLTNGMAIGVAVGDRPEGPFRDALGKPLFDNGSWDNIDPTVMIDREGQAWLFWGNPTINYARLNKDMVSLDGEVKQVNQTVEGFGSPNVKERKKDVKYKDCYTEGPWIMQAPKPAQGYYLLYAAGGVPEHIAYSSAPSPEGPWTYRGEIMPLEDTKSFTNHCGVADFRGRSYFFYHTGKLPGGGGFGRSVAIEEFKYNADGSFPIIHHTDQGVEPIGTLNPYQRVESETMAWSKGVKTEQNDQTGVYVADIQNGDYIKVRCVDFGSVGAKRFTAMVAAALQGGNIEVHLDSLKGRMVAKAEVKHTGGWEVWQQVSATVADVVTGVHDVYFAFTGLKGCKLMTFDWWRFDMLDAPFVQSRVVEDGGTGAYKAVMTDIKGLPEHTLFFPQDLTAFGS
ncbi:MAG: family 43 glycosylhydrolase, partial [Prevotella sp.]|nr:family 43 glycosylhydrolase [Prevotella sp.]